MRKSVIAGMVLLTAMVLVAGCADELSNRPSAAADSGPNAAVGKQSPPPAAYDNAEVRIITMIDETPTASRTVADAATVAVIMDGLSTIEWENAKVSMSRPPDFKLMTRNTDPLASFEPQLYEVWLSPQKDRLEFVQGAQDKYGKMPAADSVKIIAILYAD